jgi:hypothetical protein
VDTLSWFMSDSAVLGGERSKSAVLVAVVLDKKIKVEVANVKRSAKK